MGPESITGYGRKTISYGEYLLALGIRPPYRRGSEITIIEEWFRHKSFQGC